MLTNEDGTTYEGQFKYGKMEGHGTKTFVNGDQYTGKFKENL